MPIAFQPGELKLLDVSLEPLLQKYESSIEWEYFDIISCRTNACTANKGFGTTTDFVALSDHPINRLFLKVRQYYYSVVGLRSKCGLDIRLYAAQGDGSITGTMLTQAFLSADLVPDYPEEIGVYLDFPLVNLIGGQRYAWAFFNHEEGDPDRRLMIKRGTNPNYSTTQYYHRLCKADLAHQASGGPTIAFFHNYSLL